MDVDGFRTALIRLDIKTLKSTSSGFGDSSFCSLGASAVGVASFSSFGAGVLKQGTLEQ